MAKTTIIDQLQKPCTIIIKRAGEKIVKKQMPVSELLYHLRGNLEREVTSKIAKQIYR